jgi:hypothetical protein
MRKKSVTFEFTAEEIAAFIRDRIEYDEAISVPKNAEVDFIIESLPYDGPGFAPQRLKGVSISFATE